MRLFKTGRQARQGAESWSGLRLYNRCDLLQFEVLFREQEEYATDAIYCSLRFYSENKKKGQLIPANKLTLWNKDKLQALLAPVEQLVEKQRCV